MLRVLVVAAVVLGLQAGQALPVSRPSGGARGQVPSPSAQPPRSAQLPPLAAVQLDSREVTFDSPRRLTLSFAEPQPIDQILGLLTVGTSFSLAIDPDVKGSFRGDLKQLTLRDALNALLVPLGLDYQVQGTVIRVRRQQPETRLFELDLLNVQRGLSRTSGDTAAGVSTVVAPDDVLSDVGEGVKALLSERGTVHVDRQAGLVQVTDVAERLNRVALYLETLQQRSGRQVRLHAQAFEVLLRDTQAIDWRGLPADASALVAELAKQGDVRMLWTPDVTVLNNAPAIMRLTTPGAESLTMTIVPQISADGVVRMSISHKWQDDAGGAARVSEADTVMRVMDGSTALMSGLQRPRDAGGRPARSELVVLVRPTVVTPASAGSR
jgi:type II secretory pathway component GspD/PulD (secretin)